VIPLGNPLIWWAGTAALFQQLWMAISKRSAASTAIVLFFLAGWAPWLMYQYRTIFAFYSIVFTPFVVMALAAALGQLLGPAYAGVERKRRAFIVGGFTLAAITLSIFFLPLWTGDVVSTPYWQIHMWLTSWV
jgi:dolichyl-phosphate-mannose--protein O-mannosyl transferase